MDERERWLGGPLEILEMKTFLRLYSVRPVAWPLSRGPTRRTIPLLLGAEAQEAGRFAVQATATDHDCATATGRPGQPGRAAAGPDPPAGAQAADSAP